MSCIIAALRRVRSLCPLAVAQKLKACEHNLMSGFIATVSTVLGNRNLRNKIFVSCFLFIVAIIYFFPNILTDTKNRLVSPDYDCLNSYLRGVYSKIESFDARIVYYNAEDALSPAVNGKHTDRPASQNFDSLGFVGNGRYGFSYRSGGKLIIGDSSQQFLQFEANRNVNPIHHVFIRDATSHSSAKYPFSGASIVDFFDGIATDFQCFSHDGQCVIIEHSYLFHRERSNIFLEKITITNQLPYSVEISIESFMKECTTSTLVIGENRFCQKSAFLKKHGFTVHIIQQLSESSFQVRAQSKNTIYLMTAVDHSTKKTSDELGLGLQTLLNEVLKEPMESLISSHKTQWNRIWQTGLSVGKSVEVNAPSALAVNETLYHLLSSVEDTLSQSEETLTDEQRTAVQQLIKHPEHTCFNGIPNIDALQLWKVPTRSFEELQESIDLWKLTLRKSGCSRLLNAGLTGFYEAVVLSVFALQFSEDHLALKTQPAYFHRNMSVRHVTYKDCGLNLGISLMPDGHAELALASEGCTLGFNLYACDAGCSQPLLLGSGDLKLPVYETVPHTPILYISESERHLQELKRTIHFRKIQKFFSPDSVSSTSEKTKHHNSLPTTFWVVVAFVIVAFHLFLVVLLYREYWVGGSTGESTYYRMDPYYDCPSEVRSSGGSGSKFSSSAKSFISNYSVPNFSAQSLYSKSNSFKK